MEKQGSYRYMNTAQLKVYEIFKKLFKTEEDAATVIEYIEGAADLRINDRKDIFLTKDDKIDIIERIERDKGDIITRIEQTKTDMIKWMLAFWFGQIVVISGILMYFLKK